MKSMSVYCDSEDAARTGLFLFAGATIRSPLLGGCSMLFLYSHGIVANIINRPYLLLYPRRSRKPSRDVGSRSASAGINTSRSESAFRLSRMR
jgi:hypothetical protein